MDQETMEKIATDAFNDEIEKIAFKLGIPKGVKDTGASIVKKVKELIATTKVKGGQIVKSVKGGLGKGRGFVVAKAGQVGSHISKHRGAYIAGGAGATGGAGAGYMFGKNQD